MRNQLELPASRGFVVTPFLALLLLAIVCPGCGGLKSGPKGSVVSFGAIGDGRVDDTESIQRAIDSGVGSIIFPRGVYRISRTITVQLDRVGPVSISGDGTARILMAGPGPAFRISGTHKGSAAPESVQPGVWQKERTPMVDGIEIVGDHPEAVGIEASGTMQATFTRLVVHSTLHGLHLTGRNRNVVIAESHFYDNRAVGILLENVNLHQINITNCHISYNRAGGVVVRGSEVRNLQIGSCDIEGNMANNSDSDTANILIDARKSSVREVAIVGCTLQHFHEPTNGANIRLIGPSREEQQKVGHLLIADNLISDVAVNIHLKHARGVTITGNSIWQGYQHNLLVEGSSQVVVGPNLFDRNPDYRPYESKDSIRFLDSEDCTLTALHIGHVLSAPAAISLERCRWFNLTSCTVLDPERDGILLKDVENSRVSDCIIRTSKQGTAGTRAIWVTGGRHNQIVNNLYSGRLEVEAGAASVSGNKSP